MKSGAKASGKEVSLEQEAKQFVSQKAKQVASGYAKKKLSAADRTVVRAYMTSYLSGLLSSGRPYIEEEAIISAYQYALRCLEFEKTNF